VTDRIEKIVAELPVLTEVTGVWAVAADRLAQGDAAFPADLGIAVARRYASDAGHVWQYRNVLDHVLRLLATTPGPGHVAQALRLVTAPEVAGRGRDRATASLLASSHPVEELAVAYTGHASEELRACLVHELVLRDVAVTETPGIADWATSSHWSHHPLRRLPLKRSSVEERVDLPKYALHGESYSMPYGAWDEHGLPVLTGAPVPSATETTTAADAQAMTGAVANWAEESNGRMEARAFALADPLEAGSVPAALLTLGLECVKGEEKKSTLLVSPCPPAQVWRVLFAAASTGGAYNSGLRGAYGRLAAWQSLAALAGAPQDAPFAEAESLVRESTWYGFDAETAWFDQVAWDFGIAALAPDGRRLAVLAATDTD
jgi:hypothetical protein